MITPAIKGFTGEHRYLSNFFIEPDDSFVEWEYQRAKCASWSDRARFDKLFDAGKLSPGLAKKIGRTVKIRDDWEDVKVEIMLFYVTKKFRDHDALLWKLKTTYPAYLEETNTWGDQYWGVCRGIGQNMLGAVLMEVRDIL